MNFIRTLPPEIKRRRVYPFAIRVLHSKAELIEAIDHYVASAATPTRDRIGDWDVSNIQDFSYVFDADRNPLLVTFNEDVSSWDTSNATNMYRMFYRCRVFNSDISRWNVSNVTNMSCMFYGCTVFNSDVSGWNVSNVTNMYCMFFRCTVFNSVVSGWNVSNVTDMGYMFRNCRVFNSDVSGWNVSNVTNMRFMFDNCTAFNSVVSGWNVSNATNMRCMFDGCEVFSSDVSHWNVSNVTNMSSMFHGCTVFNSDVSHWNVVRALARGFGEVGEGLHSLRAMFYQCDSFNREHLFVLPLELEARRNQLFEEDPWIDGFDHDDENLHP